MKNIEKVIITKEAAELSGEPTVIYKDSEKKRVDEKEAAVKVILAYDSRLLYSSPF